MDRTSTKISDTTVWHRPSSSSRSRPRTPEIPYAGARRTPPLGRCALSRWGERRRRSCRAILGRQTTGSWGGGGGGGGGSGGSSNVQVGTTLPPAVEGAHEVCHDRLYDPPLNVDEEGSETIAVGPKPHHPRRFFAATRCHVVKAGSVEVGVRKMNEQGSRGK